MKTIPEARPLFNSVRAGDVNRKKKHTHDVTLSSKSQMPRKVCSTPRTATFIVSVAIGNHKRHSPAEIMCEMGEVTLMLRKPAMQIRKPNTPCSIWSAWQSATSKRRLAVIAAPVKKVRKGAVSSEKTMPVTFHTSPLRMMNGAMTNALSRFWLQASVSTSIGT